MNDNQLPPGGKILSFGGTQPPAEVKKPDPTTYDVGVISTDGDTDLFQVTGFIGLNPYIMTVSSDENSVEIAVPMDRLAYVVKSDDKSDRSN